MVVDDAAPAEDTASGSGPADGTKMRGESDDHRPLFPVASSSGKQSAGLVEISGLRESSALVDALWPKTGGKAADLKKLSTPPNRVELRVAVRLLRWNKERARVKAVLVACSFANRQCKGLPVTQGTKNQAEVSRGKIKGASSGGCGPKTTVAVPWPVSKASRSDSLVPGDN